MIFWMTDMLSWLTLFRPFPWISRAVFFPFYKPSRFYYIHFFSHNLIVIANSIFSYLFHYIRWLDVVVVHCRWRGNRILLLTDFIFVFIRETNSKRSWKFGITWFPFPVTQWTPLRSLVFYFLIMKADGIMTCYIFIVYYNLIVSVWLKYRAVWHYSINLWRSGCVCSNTAFQVLG